MIKTKSWPLKTQADFLDKLGQLLEQGYSLINGMEMVSARLPQKLKHDTECMISRFRQGLPVHQVFHEFGFPLEFIGSLVFSNQHGNLARVLMQGGKYLKQKEDWKKRFSNALRYPLLLFFLTIWMGVLFLNFLFPQFHSLYRSLHVELPLFTRVVMYALEWIPYFIYGFAAFLFIGFVGFLAVRQKWSSTAKIKVLMAVPIVKKYVPLLITYRFCLHISALLESGLSIVEALHLLESNPYGGFLCEEAVRLKKGLLQGIELPVLIGKHTYFTCDFSAVIIHGQSVGTLYKELESYGNWLFVLFEEKLFQFFQKIQPVLFALIGSIVLILFISMLLPMFKMIEAI